MKSVIQLITSNRGKAEEYMSLLDIKNFAFEILPLDVTEIQEADIKEISRHKIEAALKQVQTPRDFLMVDDVSLGFKALGGFPGAYIKWLLKSMKPGDIYPLLKAHSTEATAICLVTLYDFTRKKTLFFEGEVKGDIVPDTGQKGFGWDSIFKPRGLDKTFGEIPLSLKNSISHRALAVNKLRQYLLTEYRPDDKVRSSF